MSYISLKAAAEQKVNGFGKETSFKIDPDIIEIETGFNRPIDPDHVNGFKASIKGGATIPPIYVRVEKGRTIMVDGEHRLIAVKELIKEGYPIKSMSAIQFRGSDADRVAHLLTSSQGKNLSPLDAGLQYLKLTKLNWSAKDIADKIGRSITHVETCLNLAGANVDVQVAIKNKEISSTQAAEIVKEHGTQAGAVIKKELAAAHAQGKHKVTTKTIAATKPPTDKQILDYLEANTGKIRLYTREVMGKVTAGPTPTLREFAIGWLEKSK